MEGRLEQWLKQKINGVMPPLNVKQVPTAEIHHRLVEVCGDSVMSRQFLVCRILNRSSDVPRSGRTTTAGTAVNKTHGELAILENRLVTVYQLTHDLNLSCGTVSRMNVQLRFQNVCARWVTQLISTKQREWHMPFNSCNNMPFTAKTFWNAFHRWLDMGSS